MRAGRAALAVEGRGRRIAVADWLSADDVTAAARTLAEHVMAVPVGARAKREMIVETIDGQPPVRSPHLEAFRRAGVRLGTDGLRWWGS